MADPLDPTDTARDTSRRRVSLNRPGRDDVPAILVKVLFLGVVIGTAIALTPAMASVWEPLGKAYSAIVSGKDPVATIKSAGDTINKAIADAG